MSEARIDRIANENNTGGPTLSGITTFSGQQYFIPPSGSTAQRPSDCPPGSIRFNTDSAHLEYFSGLQWLEFEASSVELGGGTGSNTGTGHRGLFSRGYVAPGNVNTINYITISTLGDAQDFGDTLITRRQGTAFSSSTRSFTAGAENQDVTIDFVTISSTGNAQDFADLVVGRDNLPTSCSNSTRGLVAGGGTGSPSGRINNIDYVTMASTGVNAQDFGDLTFARYNSMGRAQSSVRGFVAGNRTPSYSNAIDYVTFSTLGNGQDYGDLTAARGSNISADSSTRGIFAGGYVPSGGTNIIDFITMATLGDAQDFGDLSAQSRMGNGGTSSPTRGVFSFGYVAPAVQNTIEFVTIATTGNSSDFGDLTALTQQAGASSNGHGGL